MTPAMYEVLAAVSAAINKEKPIELSEAGLLEAEQQTVLSLVSSNSKALSYIAANTKIMWEQQQLSEVLAGVPYLILKGSCAATYYPVPIRRSMGDIDIIVSPEHFEDAFNLLKNAGYHITMQDARHIHFKKNNTIIELHRRYATLHTQKQEELLDGWLYSAVPVLGIIEQYTFPMPPNLLNGLVLLTHINQHLEEGLGLRQIVDWIMYVKHSLPDEMWPAFQNKTDQLGLTQLAKITTRLGQKYLNTNNSLTWCLDVNEKTVDQLLEYIFEYGNFGQKDSENNTMVMVMSHGYGFIGFFRNLQSRGMENWILARKYPFLKPFSWIYQLFRYVNKGIQSGGLKSFGFNIRSSRKRNALLQDLEATRYAHKERH